MSIAACISSPTPRPQAYEDARETVRRFLNAPSAERDHLHPQRHRGDQSRRAVLRRHGDRARATRSSCRSWSTTPTSCPGISTASASGAVIKWAPVDDDGNFLIDEFEKLLAPRTKIVAITHMSNALGTIVPIKEVIRHRPCPRHPGAGRRQPGGGAYAHRRAGPRCRFLCLHRPQDLWADRHRRPLRQGGASRARCRPIRAAAR